jgi:hypothetical protein
MASTVVTAPYKETRGATTETFPIESAFSKKTMPKRLQNEAMAAVRSPEI